VTTQRLSSGGPWEARYGYCRAVVVDRQVWVSGCTAMDAGDAAAQTRAAFGVALLALSKVGGGAANVVRTRMYVVDRADADAVASVHGELFGAHPPASTLVVVAGLLEPAMRVEVELEAHLDAS
jgi:enamine deaminase RidA (YjgF/YER057c/UK114 family)